MTPTQQLVVFPLLIGYILDLIFGDPRRLPHPIIWFGNAISFIEKRLNRGNNRKIKGAFGSLILIMLAYSTVALISHYIHYTTSIYIEILFSSIVLFYMLANRTLIKESKRVITVLEKDGIEAGRRQLSWIVGRDTSKLNHNDIYKAVLETMSENLSDGVVAPLFFYAIGGVPAMACYKMINTLDSMIGYKNERYLDFGMVAAKVDDVANFIPARLTALLISIAGFSFRAVRFAIRYGNKHSSPNAGYPESALAGALDCQFGGPNIYHGILVTKPYIGENSRELNRKDLSRSISINHITTLLSVAVIAAIYILWL